VGAGLVDHYVEDDSAGRVLRGCRRSVAVGRGVYVTVTEVPATNLTAISGTAYQHEYGTSYIVAPGNPFTDIINSFHGVRLTFTNVEVAGCTYTQGFWKTLGPSAKANNSNEWPVASLTLGTVVYTAAELQAILNTPVKDNGLISLAHQLIAAKLNVANGASSATIAASIAAADPLIGALVIPPVGGGSLDPSTTSALTGALAGYNEGVTGPGHCDDEVVSNQADRSRTTSGAEKAAPLCSPIAATCTDPTHPESPYQRTKLDAEEALRRIDPAVS
jgi:hypothetical protein